MFMKNFAWVGWVAVLFFAFGCGHRLLEPTPLDKNWGKSFERAKASQELNPEAFQNVEPVTGLDGQAAENDMIRYRESHGPKENSSGTAAKFFLGTLGSPSGQ
jgi:hypothetical protein